MNSNRKWTSTLIAKEARKYESRWNFQKGSAGAYRAALRLKILDKVCKHMSYTGNRFKRALYAFEFSDKSVYVGLTYNFDKRYKQHLNNTILIKDKSNNLNFVFKKYHKWYHIDDIGDAEVKLINKYRGKGWTILNKSKGGELGGNLSKWSLALIKEKADKCSSRNEFKKRFRNAYSAALRHSVMEEVCKHMTPPRKPWTFEEVRKIASTCKTKKEFSDKFGGAYKWALDNNKIKELSKHMLSTRLILSEKSKNTGCKPVECICTGKSFKSISEASRYYNIPSTNISKCCKGFRFTAGGYRWEYC